GRPLLSELAAAPGGVSHAESRRELRASINKGFTKFHRRRFYNTSVKLRLERMTDLQLLDLRLCDLPIKISGSPLEQRVEKLYRELEARYLSFRPHVWLGEEWFTPDGVGGFAI